MLHTAPGRSSGEELGRIAARPDPAKGEPSVPEEDLLQAGYRYALALTHHHQDAEDLVQQGWLRLYRRYGGVEQLSLLFTTIRRLFLDQLQRKTRLRFISLDDLEDGEIDDISTESAEPSLARIDVERLLARLKIREREVLFFHYVQGYTAAEIGRLTGQPRGTVLSLLQRSKQKMGGSFTRSPLSEISGARLQSKRPPDRLPY